jgi:hypothetical protein
MMLRLFGLNQTEYVMQKRHLMSLLCLLLLVGVLFAACSSQNEGDPAAAVETYLSAMVANDSAKLPQLICPAYEAGAQTDFDSMGAVGGAALNGVDCTAGAVNADSSTVTCTGTIDFTYNGENQSLDLTLNSYLAQKVDGQWKMCGYQ